MPSSERPTAPAHRPRFRRPRGGRPAGGRGARLRARLCARLADMRRRRGGTWRSHHDRLLMRVRPARCDSGSRARRPDGIVVPTCRPDPHLRRGIRFALELGRVCRRPVLFLCSKDAATESALEGLGKLVEQVGEVRALVLTLQEDGTVWTSFAVDDLPLSRAYRGGRGAARWEGSPGLDDDGGLNDVGRKRNLALLVASALGWRHVLFLDDDVFPRQQGLRRRTLDRATLSAAVRRVEDGSLDAVGWVLRRFDDNSLLHRVRATLGRRQGQFIGGGALLVAVTDGTPFFPLIYNEDWLFLLGYAARRPGSRRIAVAGEVGQEEYDPWTRRRARAEEFGDVLGEGWATRAEAHAAFWTAPPVFWRAAFKERIRLRRELQAAVDRSRHRDAPAMRAALLAVQEVQRALTPALARQFAAYGPAWRADLDRWAARIRAARELPPEHLLDVAGALGAEVGAVSVLGGEGDVHSFLTECRGSLPHDRGRDRPAEPAAAPAPAPGQLQLT